MCSKRSDPILKGYTDADMTGDLDDRKIHYWIFVYIFNGRNIMTVTEVSHTLSTTEAKYIVTTKVGKKMVWLKRFLQELGLHQKEYVVCCDNRSAIDLSNNTMYHSKMKHINVRSLNSSKR